MCSIYARNPIRTVDGIPVFSEEDSYIENYRRISDDHLTSLK
jgi:hypothetical protein